MLDPLVLKMLSLGFGTMFLLAAIHKLSARQQFRATLAAYRLLPESLAGAAAIALPLTEAVLGGAWLAGFGTATVALASSSLLALYTVAIVINLWRGRVHIDCGCSMGGHAGGEQMLSWGLVGRNAALVLAALLASLPAGERSIGALDYLTLIAGLLSVVFLYAAANQLLSNGAAIGAWRKRHD